MKYAIVIPDGAADLPIAELGGRTPLQAAEKPHLDGLAMSGRARLGTVHTTPAPFDANSDVCCMTLLGYDAGRYHTGRAPLEAAALGLSPGPADWIFRLNWVTTSDLGGASAEPAADGRGVMVDHSAGAISDGESRRLCADVSAFWAECEPALAEGLALTPGVSYRNILVDSSGRTYAKDVTREGPLKTRPPHEIPGQPWRDHLPTGLNAAVIVSLIDASRALLGNHPVNRARIAGGKRPASSAWIWGQGTRPSMPRFEEMFGVRGCMITPVDLLAGIAAYAGWARLACPGISSYHDNDYAAQGRLAAAALDDFDLVICHVESPDEASHQGDWKTKVAAIEAIDEHVVGPVLARLRSFGDPEEDARAPGWRLLVLPDHYTLCSTRKHDATPPPFLMGGARVRSARPEPFNEFAAAESGLHINPGDGLMEFFLRSGLGVIGSASSLAMARHENYANWSPDRAPDRAHALTEVSGRGI
ncbi:MAG: hypothetical protein IBJ11_06975, partial [Phycisphaerales bacterium]|nr:hypothetical protein [Phycisphaerales bacterium]